MKKRMRNGSALVWALLLVLVGCLMGCSGGSEEETLPGLSVGTQATAEAAESGTAGTERSVQSGTENALTQEAVCVYVCGCVEHPGVYALPADARVEDAVEAAGGFAGGADSEYWNLAETVTDGEKIRIPSKEEGEELAESQAAAASSEAAAEAAKVNLNTADREELMTLPGIGEAKADAILAYREKQAFSSIEDIMKVSGIKEAGFAKIRDLITVAG